MSRRVVDYNYRRLNIMLEKLQLPKLIAVPSKGILMPTELVTWFNELTSDFRNNVEYLYSREERLAYCMSLIIIGRRAYSIDSLAESLNVNRSTIYYDLRRVKKEVEQCGGELTHDKYYKYYIKATGRDYVRMLQNQQIYCLKPYQKSCFQWLSTKKLLMLFRGLYGREKKEFYQLSGNLRNCRDEKGG